MSGVYTTVLAGLLVSATAAAQPVCASWVAAGGRTPLDLAPPRGYTEVCSQDTALCQRLTSGYPPSVATRGYFVPTEDWASFQRGESRGFRQYLIAQEAISMTANDFPALKAHLARQQGNVPDNTRLPAELEAAGRATLGIFDETDRSISFGVVMRARAAGAAPDAPELALVGTNTAAVIGGVVLSLYVFRTYTGAPDIRAAQDLTKQWLSCLTATK
jgi:hypothetical protein